MWAMYLPLRILTYASCRQLRCGAHARAARSISSTAKLKDAPLPSMLKPEIDAPNAAQKDADPYEPFRTQEKPRLLRPILFTISIGICTFGGAAYLTNREFQERTRATTTSGSLVGDLRHERIMRELRHANATYAWLREKGCPGFVLRSYARLGDYWLNANEGERVALALVALNTIVFLAWQIPLPAVRFFMVKHFMHHPLSGRSYTLLTSTFSHMNLLHFGINMVALQSFVRESSFYIGSTESLDPNFRGVALPYMFHLADPNYAPKVLAFFIVAGVFSMFGFHASHALRLIRTLRQTPDIASLSKARKAIRPSLGASGAIYGTLALTALAVPDVEVQLFFLPFLTLPIKWGVAGLVAMDITGIVRGWRVLDHYGHLSGAAFGGAYFFAGPYVWTGAGKRLSWENVRPKP